MDFVKYWAPGPRFDNRKFAETVQSLDVMCAPVSGGVVVDREKLNLIPENSLPAWVRMNRSSINNPLCTCEPTDRDAQEVFG